MLKSPKSHKLLQSNFLSLLLSNQKEILKKGISWTEEKQKGTTFKVQSIAIANPLYTDLIHQYQADWLGPLLSRDGKVYKRANNVYVNVFLAGEKSVPNFMLFCHKSELFSNFALCVVTQMAFYLVFLLLIKNRGEHLWHYFCLYRCVTVLFCSYLLSSTF